MSKDLDPTGGMFSGEFMNQINIIIIYCSSKDPKIQ